GAARGAGQRVRVGRTVGRQGPVVKTQPGPIVGDPSAPVPATAQSDRLDPKRRRLGVLARRWAAIWRPAGIFGASRAATIGAVAGLTACLLLWRLVHHLSGPASADRAVALFCFFPGAMILSLPYSEGLMLALAIGCLHALLRRRWVTAGVLAALATATRPNAMALVAACAWAAAVAVWRRREWRALAAPALAPLGLVAFFAYLARHTGDAGAYWRTQRQAW